ncbi:MAG: hypothetical protein JWP12_3058 [Bacteroidetes bacterium]|nr:hypothetical protein [Bacteroidota bacterium]
MNLLLKTPNEKEFQQICGYIREFELDNRNLQQQEFTAAYRDDELVGFGRLRLHADCTELCSLGVVTDHRKQGIGKAIVAELIRRAPAMLYLVCIIPDYFQPFGLVVVQNYPASIKNKLQYCTQELVVPELYTAMLLQK